MVFNIYSLKRYKITQNMLNKHIFWFVISYCILYKMEFSLNITRHL